MTTENFDYTPWSDEADASYERFMEKREKELYDKRMAEFEADGGDVSMEIEDGLIPNPIEEVTEDSVPPWSQSFESGHITESEQAKHDGGLSPMQRKILGEWKDYP